MKSKAAHHTQNLLKKLGFSESDSAVLTALILSDEPMTAGELSRSTGYSPASISLSLMRLRRHYLVEKARRGGRNVYWPSKGLAESFNMFVRELLEGHIRPFLRTLDEEDKGERALDKLRKELKCLEGSLRRLIEGV
ncbi:hypothetical protein B6U83_04255 [Thermoplasmatales archaeon ex4484_36]|nr:MAG: hypothetical protein B6U83_04255 [Thermoplasmatales archaeon ex4484_36]RLF56242.1 MAG: hypothetical protein DRN28_00950 [Thermoplasmata archaeon]HDD59732.1 ArsR family transcriptional regulator [Euryarchaeota archaeon]RLF71200.1 MAG: hypothetical protein DRN40_02985 [Thermoplasmata archaeon]RLF72583.1 MAG: hypothetical protein DRN35_00330 [Thermoplasmata archaeon]